MDYLFIFSFFRRRNNYIFLFSGNGHGIIYLWTRQLFKLFPTFQIILRNLIVCRISFSVHDSVDLLNSPVRWLHVQKHLRFKIAGQYSAPAIIQTKTYFWKQPFTNVRSGKPKPGVFLKLFNWIANTIVFLQWSFSQGRKRSILLTRKITCPSFLQVGHCVSLVLRQFWDSDFLQFSNSAIEVGMKNNYCTLSKALFSTFKLLNNRIE